MTLSGRKFAFSAFFTKNPFCRGTDAPRPGGFSLFIMPKLKLSCNILSFQVMYCIGAVKRKIWWGGCEADTLDLSKRLYLPSDGFLGAVWYFPLPTPPKKLCTRLTAASRAFSSFTAYPSVLWYFQNSRKRC